MEGLGLGEAETETEVVPEFKGKPGAQPIQVVKAAIPSMPLSFIRFSSPVS